MTLTKVAGFVWVLRFPLVLTMDQYIADRFSVDGILEHKFIYTFRPNQVANYRPYYCIVPQGDSLKLTKNFNILDETTSSARALASSSVCVTPIKFLYAIYFIL